MLNKIIERWNNFWFQPISKWPLQQFSRLFGAYLFLYYLKYLGQVEIQFSNLGINSPFYFSDYTPNIFIAWSLYLFTLIVCLLLTFNIKTRFITPLLLALHLHHYFINFAVQNTAYDRIIIIFLILLSIKSVLSCFEKDSLSKTFEPGWLIKLLCVQTSFFYFGTGIYKLLKDAWHTAEIIPMTMASQWASPAAFWVLDLNLPDWFYLASAWGVIGLELALGFMLWIKPIQKYAFALGILFHLSVWVFLNIPEFMICTLPYILFIGWDKNTEDKTMPV